MVNWIIRFMSVCFDRSASSRVVKGKTRLSSPPFRDKANQQSLWAGLQAGSLQVVATDHCAFSIDFKTEIWVLLGFADQQSRHMDDAVDIVFAQGMHEIRQIEYVSANISDPLNYVLWQ